MNNLLKVALAQISPIWLDKTKTIEKVKSYIEDAGKQQCNLIVFGEGLLPGYPFWLSLTMEPYLTILCRKKYMHTISGMRCRLKLVI